MSDPTTVTNIAIIAAVSRGGLVGGPDGMPWDVPADMKHFRDVTMGHTIIMGRNTWDTLSGPLKGRQNIILTSRDIEGNEIETATSLEAAIELAELPGEVFVIGGVQPWSEALKMAQRIYLTHIDEEFEGDVFFPELDDSVWKKETETVQEAHINGTVGTIRFTTYTR